MELFRVTGNYPSPSAAARNWSMAYCLPHLRFQSTKQEQNNESFHPRRNYKTAMRTRLRNGIANECPPTVPQMEFVVSETESEVSGSFSGFSTLSGSSPRSSPSSSCAYDLRITKKKSEISEREEKPPKEKHYASRTDRSYEEREIRRKERNNAASRKSRALRKRRFQQMLQETERLTNSNARLRAFVEELNSIMAESRAILFETFAGSVSTDVASIAHQETNQQPQHQPQQINHLRE
ncbi:hypothetical protein ACTXT7_004482 [Hymenolepis weldensis]